MNITIRELKSMIMNFEGVNPKISENTYISESVDIIGNVVIEENANIWFGTRLRADMNQIVLALILIFKKIQWCMLMLIPHVL